MRAHTDESHEEERLQMLAARLSGAAEQRQFPDLMELLLEEYGRTGGYDEPGEEGTYNNNLHLIITWQAAAFEEALRYPDGHAQQDILFGSFVRTFLRVVQAEISVRTNNEMAIL